MHENLNPTCSVSWAEGGAAGRCVVARFFAGGDDDRRVLILPIPDDRPVFFEVLDSGGTEKPFALTAIGIAAGGETVLRRYVSRKQAFIDLDEFYGLVAGTGAAGRRRAIRWEWPLVFRKGWPRLVSAAAAVVVLLVGADALLKTGTGHRSHASAEPPIVASSAAAPATEMATPSAPMPGQVAQQEQVEDGVPVDADTVLVKP